MVIACPGALAFIAKFLPTRTFHMRTSSRFLNNSPTFWTFLEVEPFHYKTSTIISAPATMRRQHTAYTVFFLAFRAFSFFFYSVRQPNYSKLAIFIRTLPRIIVFLNLFLEVDLDQFLLLLNIKT